MYDLDGVLADSADSVFRDFENENQIRVYPYKIDSWEYLTYIAKTSNLSDSQISNAESGWYDPEILGRAKRYSYTRPLVSLTMKLAGVDNNFVLTSRNSNIPMMKDKTNSWINKHFGKFPDENRLIWDPNSGMKASEFKAEEIKKRAKMFDWVVFMDDSGRYTKAALNVGCENILAINIPLGVIKPSFDHERLIVVGRYPEESQSMYPLYWAFKKAATDLKRY
jgi:hypothetical protein